MSDKPAEALLRLFESALGTETRFFVFDESALKLVIGKEVFDCVEVHALPEKLDNRKGNEND